MSDVNKQLLEAVKEFFDAEQSEGREKFGHFYKPATREHQQRELIARAKLHEAIAAAEQAQPVWQDELNCDDIERLRMALSWEGYSTPEGLEHCAARWPELVRDLIRAVLNRKERARLADSNSEATAPETCNWYQDDDDGSWHSDCGSHFNLNEGTPSENGMAYCHKCGKPMQEHPWTEDEQEGGENE